MNINYRKLTMTDELPLLGLVNGVIAAMPDKSMWVPDSRNDMVNWLKGKDGVMIGAFNKNKLIGFGTLVFTNKTTYDIYGCMVLPEYRGMGIQRELINRRLNYATGLGGVLAIAQVHPGNKHSLDNLLSVGFIQSPAIILPSGHTRIPMELDLNKNR